MIGVVVLLSVPSQILGFDLLGDIASVFEKYNYSNDYMSDFYNSKYSKDPFGDTLKTIDDMSMQVKLLGVKYVENALNKKNCRMPQKKIVGILYYFSPEFRSDISRALKTRSGNIDSKKYIADEEKIAEYCQEYYKCVNSEDDKSISENKQKISELIAATPDDVKTSCKEFFSRHYNEGRMNADLLQNIQTSQLGADRYWNATIDDSPYDIMTDLGINGKALFEEAEGPITPVFYNLPVFAKSAKSLTDGNGSNSGGNGGDSSNNSDGSSGNGEQSGAGENNGGQGNNQQSQNQGDANGDTNGESNGSSSGNPSSPAPLKGGSETIEDGFDEMLEGLLSDSYSVFKGVMCNEEEEPEPEPKFIEPQSNDENEDMPSESLGLSPEEFQAAVDYMLGAVDKYSSLSEDDKNAISQRAGDNSRYVRNNEGLSQEDQLQKIADEIKTCWASCEGLRFDQKASCRLMCACGKLESPIFDPENTPGLGPIAIVKFCTVPGVDSRFSVGGRKMVSIEEGVKEIFGVVDKLSREGRLGIWTQQYNFLDSSTKKMNFAKSMSFSISVDWIDIASNGATQSQQFKEKEAKRNNTMWQTDYHIKNSLDNPLGKNRYRLAYEPASNDFSVSTNSDIIMQAMYDNSVELESLIDQSEVSKYDRYVKLSKLLLNDRMDQEGEFWNFTLDWINDLNDSAKFLLSKKG